MDHGLASTVQSASTVQLPRTPNAICDKWFPHEAEFPAFQALGPAASTKLRQLLMQ